MHREGVRIGARESERTAAFGALAEECWGRAYAVALGVLRDRHAAEDAAQEALLSAFARLDSLRDTARFEPWLFRIVQNEARMRHRRRRRVAPSPSLDARPAPDPGAEKRPWKDAELAAAIGALTPKQRDAVALRWLAGLAPGDVAEFLGVSPETVRKRLHDGLARLRALGRGPLPPPRLEPVPIPPPRKEILMSRIPNVLEFLESSAGGKNASESAPRQALVVSLMDRLLMDRIVFLSGRIDAEAATSAVLQLLFLQKENREQPVHLYVCSPGGDLFAGLAIYDTMRSLACPVHTYAVGLAGGVAALLVAGGARGSRFALPSAALTLHEPRESEGGGLAAQVREAAAASFRARLVDLFANHTGAERDRVERDVAGGLFLTAEQAKDYGLVDEVVLAPRTA